MPRFHFRRITDAVHETFGVGGLEVRYNLDAGLSKASQCEAAWLSPLSIPTSIARALHTQLGHATWQAA